MVKMRIVSMVPSWTETLIEANAEVVGRTRFCIHPRQRAKAATVVGGTKNWDFRKVLKLKPDLIVLDKEENTAEMAAQASDFAVHVTHIRNISDLAPEMRKLAKVIGRAELISYAERLEKALTRIPLIAPEYLPGVKAWLVKPANRIEKVIYIIWQDPWMAVSQDTFIGSMLERFVDARLLMNATDKYPKISLESFRKESTLLLFSSEPFPFEKQIERLSNLGFPSAIVDGEAWGWFGIRAIRFLEEGLSV